MGRQVNFFLHPDEAVEFDLLLKSSDDLDILPNLHYDGKVSVLSDSLKHDYKKEGRLLYLIKKENSEKVRLKEFPQLGYWQIENRQLPVVHLVPAVLNKKNPEGWTLF